MGRSTAKNRPLLRWLHLRCQRYRPQRHHRVHPWCPPRQGRPFHRAKLLRWPRRHRPPPCPRSHLLYRRRLPVLPLLRRRPAYRRGPRRARRPDRSRRSLGGRRCSCNRSHRRTARWRRSPAATALAENEHGRSVCRPSAGKASSTPGWISSADPDDDSPLVEREARPVYQNAEDCSDPIWESSCTRRGSPTPFGGGLEPRRGRLKAGEPPPADICPRTVAGARPFARDEANQFKDFALARRLLRSRAHGTQTATHLELDTTRRTSWTSSRNSRALQ